MEEIKRIIFASDSGTSRAAMAAGILRSLPIFRWRPEGFWCSSRSR